MPRTHIVWLGLWAIYLFGVYAPSARRFRRRAIVRDSTRWADLLMDVIVFITWQVLPLIAIFSGGLSFADYVLPNWTFWPGAGLMISAYLVLLLAYRRLGENWSPKMDVRQSHELVTGGIYRRIRHPIYAGLWLWALAHPLLLHNWISGMGMAAAFSVLYFTRVPREEAMLLAHFGASYEEYMQRTGRLLPRRRSP